MSGQRSIDHPVLAVRNLDEAAAAWEGLGFTLTPRASHPDHMGTANRLVQFANRVFLELLEVDRPATVAPHGPEEVPPRFSFGAHNRDVLQDGPGLSMLALTTADAHADLEALAARGVRTFAPFAFERQTTLPDGSQALVGFSLGFATLPGFPGSIFFLCQHKAPQHFWKERFQTHANGAVALEAVYLRSAQPAEDAAALAVLTGGVVRAVEDGVEVGCGGQALVVATPAQLARLAPNAEQGPPGLAGIAIAARNPPVAPATVLDGIFIAWRQAA
ncbi:VOC family protein [Marinibaculum pumilum]|uniref:VOC family protein n=1 Tax=Marinibaculum pumilum TaxID=1766165 RepID=A0ABV7L891_9PROT